MTTLPLLTLSASSRSIFAPACIRSLVPLEVASDGPGRIESVSSYLGRLAHAHQMSVSHLIITAGQLVGSSRWKGKEQVNVLQKGHGLTSGYSQQTLEIVDLLASATGHLNLRDTTLAHLGSALAPRGVGSLKSQREWCALCFREREQSAMPVFDNLSWSVRLLHDCPKHGVRLADRCGSCGAHQKHTSYWTSVGSCCACGATLAKGMPSSARALTSDIDSESWQRWIGTSVEDLLSMGEHDRKHVHPDAARLFIGTLRDSRSQSFGELEKRIGLSKSLLGGWANGRVKPRLECLLVACGRLGVSPVLVLTNPKTAALQLELMECEETTLYTIRTGRRYARVDLKLIDKTLDSVLSDPNKLGKVSRDEVRRSLGVSQGTLWYHCNDRIKAISRAYREAQKASRRASTESEVARCATLLALRTARGLETHARVVVPILSAELGISEHRARAILSQAMKVKVEPSNHGETN